MEEKENQVKKSNRGRKKKNVEVITETADIYKKEILNEVKKIISNQLGIAEDKIKIENNLAIDLVADSLDVVEMLMAIEEKFNITVPDDICADIQTVKDVVDFIYNLTDNKK